MTIQPKILIVEDDMDACGMLVDYLQENGFDVQCVETATEAISWFKNDRFDLILLDLNLPDYNGLEVLRSANVIVTVPILVISGIKEKSSKLAAFKLGAVDYIVKPIDLEELEARIWTQLRRGGELSPNSHKDESGGTNLFELREGSVFCRGKLLELTMSELNIFLALLENRNRVVPRSNLVALLESNISERSLDNYIKNVRKKLDGCNLPSKQILKTVYGGGYMLVDSFKKSL